MSRRFTIYLSEDQKNRIDRLPRGTSFSKIVRDNFDFIMEEYEDKSINMSAAN